MRRSIAKGWLGSVLALLIAACGGGGSGSAQLSFSPNTAPPPTGTTGVTYPTFTFVAPTGGLGPFVWTESGALPPGMTLSRNGQLSGTPTNPGTFPLTLTVTDSSSPNQAAEESVTLLVNEGPLVIDATSLPPGGRQTQPYSFGFTASGGSAPFSWRVTAGAPPSGLVLDAKGMLSGTPVNAGATVFTVTVQDSSATPQTDSHAFTIVILPPLPIVNVSPSSTVIGVGQIVTFNWTSSYASSCTGNGVAGLVGSPIATSGTVTVTDANTMGAIGFTVTCTGPGGTGTNTAPVAVTSTTAGVDKLVADSPGPNASPRALNYDSNLVNPWGIAFPPGLGAFVANEGTSTSTNYDSTGMPQPGSALVITFPTGTGGATFRPTGVVTNPTADFVIGSGAYASPARLIYAGQSGMIAAWAPSLGAAAGVATYTDTGGAVYTGLAAANNGGANFLYAADFHGNKIDVFDGTFKKQTPSTANFSFSDPSLPAGYAPFGIQAIDNGSGGAPQLYVTYAQPQGTNATPTAGPGLGVVDIFDANGSLVRQLVVGGTLNAPWGVALAPTDFGSFGGLLLVSNFGDGKVNAFDPATGQPHGPLSSPDGTVVSVPGLRAIAFGNDVTTESHDTLFFTAGPDNGANGLFGRIDLVHTTPVVSSITVTTCTTPTPVCSPGASTITANITSQVPVALVEFFINGAYYQSFIGWDGPPYWESWPLAEPIHLITVTAFDVNGNMGTRSINY